MMIIYCINFCIGSTIYSRCLAVLAVLNSRLILILAVKQKEGLRTYFCIRIC